MTPEEAKEIVAIETRDFRIWDDNVSFKTYGVCLEAFHFNTYAEAEQFIEAIKKLTNYEN